MDNIEAVTIARDNVCSKCAGNLVPAIRKDPTTKRYEDYVRCVNGHDIATVGYKKIPLTATEKAFVEEAVRHKVNNNAKEAKSMKDDTRISTIKEAPLTKEQQESNQFALRVLSQLKASDSQIVLSEHQERLAKRLWMACSVALRDLEEKRKQENPKDLPIIWSNIDIEQLAIDAWRRIDLGLDAMVPNHIHPVPFHQGRSGKYKLELMIGYAGKDFYKRKVALEEPIDIVYELVHENDQFLPIKSASGDSYELRQPNPFKRGTVIGGFGYIKYDDSRKNQLVLVEDCEFEAARKAAKTQKFWKGFEVQMKYVVLVRKTTKELKVDPRKINDSYRVVETEDAILAGEPVPEFAISTVVDGQVTPETQEKTGQGDAAKLAASAASLSGTAPEGTAPPPDTAKTDYPHILRVLGVRDMLTACWQHGDGWVKDKNGQHEHEISPQCICKWSGPMKALISDACAKQTPPLLSADLNAKLKTNPKYGDIWVKLTAEQQCEVLEDLCSKIAVNPVQEELPF